MSTTTAKTAKTDCGSGVPIIYNNHVVGNTAKFIVEEPKALQPLQGILLSSQNVGEDFEEVLKRNITKGSKGDANFFRCH